MNRKQTVERLKQIRDTPDIVTNSGHPFVDLEEALRHFHLKAPDCEVCMRDLSLQLLTHSYSLESLQYCFTKYKIQHFKCKIHHF